jgi:hypothetical protein
MIINLQQEGQSYQSWKTTGLVKLIVNVVNNQGKTLDLINQDLAPIQSQLSFDASVPAVNLLGCRQAIYVYLCDKVAALNKHLTASCLEALYKQLLTWRELCLWRSLPLEKSCIGWMTTGTWCTLLKGKPSPSLAQPDKLTSHTSSFPKESLSSSDQQAVELNWPITSSTPTAPSPPITD